MQFTIEKEVFLKGLARIQGIVEKRNTIPILSNVLIEAGEDDIKLTATDLEVGMQASYKANVKKTGKITVSAKKLHEIIKELPEGEVSFLAKDNCWIEIRCGKALFNIVGLAADEYPYFPQTSQNNFIELPGKTMKELLDKTSFSMSTDESKYNLNGIYFKTMNVDGKEMLRLVATDGHRLAMVQSEIVKTDIEELNNGVIFPKKGIFELKKIAEEGDGNIQLGFLDNNAMVKKDQTIVIMRLVDGDFPDYNRVIPQECEHKAIIQSETFFHALRRMAILSSEKSRGVKLVMNKGLLEISSSNPELGDAREDFEIDYSGQEISVGFNARYLLDIIQSQDEEKIILQVRDNMSPGLITPAENKNYLAVVMPMRL
jgi:DNA polymerase III subunit beta